MLIRSLLDFEESPPFSLLILNRYSQRRLSILAPRIGVGAMGQKQFGNFNATDTRDLVQRCFSPSPSASTFAPRSMSNFATSRWPRSCRRSERHGFQEIV